MYPLGLYILPDLFTHQHHPRNPLTPPYPSSLAPPPDTPSFDRPWAKPLDPSFFVSRTWGRVRWLNYPAVHNTSKMLLISLARAFHYWQWCSRYWQRYCWARVNRASHVLMPSNGISSREVRQRVIWFPWIACCTLKLYLHLFLHRMTHHTTTYFEL